MNSILVHSNTEGNESKNRINTYLGCKIHALNLLLYFFPGRPHAAKIVSPRLSSFKDQYNLTWSVNSFLPIEEYRILYRVNSVSYLNV